MRTSILRIHTGEAAVLNPGLKGLGAPDEHPENRAEYGPVASTVYQALEDHQLSEQWVQRDLLAELHRWAKIFRDEFKLDIPEIALSVDALRCDVFGHFRDGHNGFGLRGEIVINSKHVGARDHWETLGTLLHELLHGWQQAHGRPGKRNYHNKEFRTKARHYGLIVDRRGFTQYEPESLFLDLLRRYGVSLPPLPAPLPPDTLSGSSKLKKWSCGCTNVRVAITDFRARCLKPECGNQFIPCG